MKLKYLTNIAVSAVLAMNMGCTVAPRPPLEMSINPHLQECRKYDKSLDENTNLLNQLSCYIQKWENLGEDLENEYSARSAEIGKLVNEKCFEIEIKKQALEDPNFFSTINPELLDSIYEYCETEK